MAKYSSKTAVIGKPAEELFARISDISAMQERLAQLPAEQLAAIGDVRFTEKSISISTPQVGEIRFDMVDCEAPRRLAFAAANSPVPLSLAVELTPKDAVSTELVSSIDVDIPAMLRPLVGGKMQEAANRFTDLIAQING